MAKSASPIRLQQDLMQSAAMAGALHHRSTAEQIEYWASLGRQIARFVDPDTLLDLASGIARLQVEPVASRPVAPEAVFAAVEQARTNRDLPALVSEAPIRYQAAPGHSGALERISVDGQRTIGSFVNGVFIPHPDNPHGAVRRDD
jgi:hypothetical protein